MKQFIFTTALLVFLSGSALGEIHDATHVVSDSGGCALCASHANPVAPPLQSGASTVPLLLPVLQVACAPPSSSASTTFCNHQRAPPP